MTDITQALCFVGIVLCLCPCLIWAFYELELERQRREQRSRFVRDAMRTVVPVTEPYARKGGQR